MDLFRRFTGREVSRFGLLRSVPEVSKQAHTRWFLYTFFGLRAVTVAWL